MQSSVCTAMTDPVVRNMNETKTKNHMCKRKWALRVETYAGNENCNFTDAFLQKPCRLLSIIARWPAWSFQKRHNSEVNASLEKTEGAELCEAFPCVLSTSGCAYTANQSAKEQTWTLACDCPSCTVEVLPDPA